MPRNTIPIIGLLATTWLGACAEPPRGALAAEWNAASPSVVDSVRPIEEELARFRHEVGGGEVRELDSDVRSRDELIAAFTRALEQRDPAALQRLLLTPAEFAWLYYPHTVYTHPPYRQAPGMVWLLTSQNTHKGMSRLLERYGGRRLEGTGYRCGRTEPQDLNVLHLDCGVLLPGDTTPRALFGSVIERNGRFKFVSYANGL